MLKIVPFNTANREYEAGCEAPFVMRFGGRESIGSASGASAAPRFENRPREPPTAASCSRIAPHHDFCARGGRDGLCASAKRTASAAGPRPPPIGSAGQQRAKVR
eukprot:2906737-Prymnesium_polylepis.1